MPPVLREHPARLWGGVSPGGPQRAPYPVPSGPPAPRAWRPTPLRNAAFLWQRWPPASRPHLLPPRPPLRLRQPRTQAQKESLQVSRRRATALALGSLTRCFRSILPLLRARSRPGSRGLRRPSGLLPELLISLETWANDTWGGVIPSLRRGK